MSTPTTRLTLLDRLRGPRDEDAWREFVGLYGPIAYRLARKKGLDRGEADLITQQFLLRAVEQLRGSFEYDRARGRFRGWVFVVAYREILQYLRKKRRQPDGGRPGGSDADDRRLCDPAAHVPDPDAQQWWENAERARLCHAALDQLARRSGADRRNVLIVRALLIEERPVGEVAAAFGVTADQLYGIKFRTLKKLRPIVEQLMEEWQ